MSLASAVLSANKPAASAAQLAHALQVTATDLQAVDKLILEKVSGEIPLIHNITHHIIASGGKRLRPMLTLLSARACNAKGNRHIALAAAVEFIHTATLLHDDVVDESKLRRGLATANEVWGNKASILVGDFLLAQAFRLMVADESLRVLDILSGAAAIISKGEVMQLMCEGDTETTLDNYLAVISAKTAELFAAACEIGAVVADTEQHAPALRGYGHAIGVAFQLVDDALDYAADQTQLGKTVGDDFREGKITLPVLIAYHKGDATEKAFWSRTMSDLEQRTEDFAHAQKLLKKHAAIEETIAMARSYCEKAGTFLTALPRNSAHDGLQEVLDFCVHRTR